MRIERINENSIRCTLTSFDLSVRNINLRELAYGTEKAKKLFDEMMRMASSEVGFEADNTPLMIEAIPTSPDSIQLVITKVEDPEELDTRFSRFSPFEGRRPGAGEDWIRKFASELLEGADGILSHIKKMGVSSEHSIELQTGNGDTKELHLQIAAIPLKGAPEQKGEDRKQETPAQNANTQKQTGFPDITFRVFAFRTLDQVIEAAKAADFYEGASSLYKENVNDSFMLVLFNSSDKQESFAQVCNAVAEYGRQIPSSEGTLAYYDEHCKAIVTGEALKRLSAIG